jgi:hypothetical protein
MSSCANSRADGTRSSPAWPSYFIFLYIRVEIRLLRCRVSNSLGPRGNRIEQNIARRNTGFARSKKTTAKKQKTNEVLLGTTAIFFFTPQSHTVSSKPAALFLFFFFFCITIGEMECQQVNTSDKNQFLQPSFLHPEEFRRQ